MVDQSFLLFAMLVYAAATAARPIRFHRGFGEWLIVYTAIACSVAMCIPPIVGFYSINARIIAARGEELSWMGSIGLVFLSVGFALVSGLLVFGLFWLVTEFYRITGAWISDEASTTRSTPATISPPAAEAPPAEAGTGQEMEKSV